MRLFLSCYGEIAFFNSYSYIGCRGFYVKQSDGLREKESIQQFLWLRFDFSSGYSGCRFIRGEQKVETQTNNRRLYRSPFRKI
jgi:hypothetical protein